MKQRKSIRESIRTGDKAFEIMVRQNHRRVLAYAMALVKEEWLAEEIVQDSFVTAYKNLHRFDTSKDFGRWIRGIVRNKYKEQMRQRKEQVLDESVLDVIERSHDEWDESEQTGKGEALTALKNCLKTLTKAMQKSIDLFYFKSRLSSEVAELTNTTDANVRKRLQRARELLSECIEARLGLSSESGSEL